jgi:hypothetical protein
MTKTILLWGGILSGCVFAPQPLYGASVEWETGREYIKCEMTAHQISSFPTMHLPDDLLVAQRTLETVSVTTSPFQTAARKITKTPGPILAMPESGTLILLGLGLAGLASLIRKKKDSA